MLRPLRPEPLIFVFLRRSMEVQSLEQVRVTARAREPVAVGKSGRRAAIIHVPVGLGGPVHVGVLVVRLRYMLELKIGDDILA